jgi:hypothetical protein
MAAAVDLIFFDGDSLEYAREQSIGNDPLRQLRFSQVAKVSSSLLSTFRSELGTL